MDADAPFELTEQRHEGEVRLAVHGELDLGTVEALEARLRELREARQPTLLDLRPLGFMDSSGLRALMVAREEAERGGWDLRMVAPEGDARDVLRISGVERLLPFVEAPE